MQFTFYKYQGTGNDFIIIDNRQDIFPKNDTKLVAHLCDRKFGVGGDGLLLLEKHESLDFKMVYYNADGNLSSMCGNGGRCIVHFARFLTIIEKNTTFEAVDGAHEASIEDNLVSLKMNDVQSVSVKDNYVFLDTGSPHHVQLVDSVSDFDVFSEGRKIRTTIYGKAGANINFVTPVDDATFSVRTYERGVEDETLSCGTGVTAVAIAMAKLGKTNKHQATLLTPGGTLTVSFDQNEEGYNNIYLEGPATQVFKGIWQ